MKNNVATLYSQPPLIRRQAMEDKSEEQKISMYLKIGHRAAKQIK